MLATFILAHPIYFGATHGLFNDWNGAGDRSFDGLLDLFNAFGIYASRNIVPWLIFATSFAPALVLVLLIRRRVRRWRAELAFAVLLHSLTDSAENVDHRQG